MLAAIITFATTYALILPAITVEKEHTDDVAGMYLKEKGTQDDLLEENALEFTGVSIAADQDNSVTYEYVDDNMTAAAVFSSDEEIPEGAELMVTSIDPESEEYIDLSSRAAMLLDREFIYDVTTCSFYDFALICDGVDVTPKTGLVDVQINFMNNTVEHVNEAVYAERFGIVAEDELVSSNPDESSVIELTDGIITVLSLKGNDLAQNDSIVGVLAGYVDEEAKVAAAETDAEVPTVDDIQEETSALEVKALKAAGEDYTVTLTYDETSGIPDGASLAVSEIAQNTKEYKTYLEKTKKAMGLTEEETLPKYAARFFDIKIMAGNKEFKPESGVSVEITYAEPLAENPETEVSAVHFENKKAKAEVIEANASGIQEDGAATVEFTAESFSVYGVIYTVDFYWEVNGKVYEFSMPGGGFLSFEALMEVMGIADGNSVDTSDDNGQSTGRYSADALSINDLDISDTTRKFVENVENVAFSSPELVWIGKIDHSVTVGEIIEKEGLEVQYSADLTEEQIRQINSAEIRAGDWALISMLPFDTQEALTVTMKDGETFTILVTDDQENPYGLSGKEFVIANTKNGTNSAMTAQIRNNLLVGQNINNGGTAPGWEFEWTGTGKEYLIHRGSQYLVYTYQQKEVVWNLGHSALLEGGGTYSVSFIVWPSQEAYDLVSDLNNGKREFDELNPVEKEQVEIKNGKYVLKTNTHESAKGKPATEESDQDGNTTITPSEEYKDIPMEKDVDPMPLDDTIVSVQKVWNDSLDPKQLEELLQANPQYKAQLTLERMVGAAEEDYITGIEIGAPSTTSPVPRTWPELDVQGNVIYHHISAGLMVSETDARASGLYDVVKDKPEKYPVTTYNNVKYYIIEEGHDYYFKESENSDYHFELEEKTWHPMVVGEDVMNVTFSSDKTTVTGMAPLSELTATNNLKGGILVYKKLYDENGNDITNQADSNVFSVTVTLTNPDGTPYMVTADEGGYRINYGTNNPAHGEAVYDNGTLVNYGREAVRHDIANGTFTVEFYAGDYVQVSNVDAGVIYAVTETDVPTGYENIGIDYKVNGATNTSSPKAVTSNDSHQVYVKNKRLAPRTVDITLRKMDVEDLDKASADPLKGASFTITKYTDSNFNVKDTTTPLAQTLTDEKMGENYSLNGIFSFTDLPIGFYQIEENIPPKGYVQTGHDPAFEVQDDLSIVLYEKDSEGVYHRVTGIPKGPVRLVDGELTILIGNQQGAALPSTGGFGTVMYYLLGVMLIGLAGAGLVMRKGCKMR